MTLAPCHRALHRAIAALAMAALAACTSMLNMDEAKTAITAGIAEQTGLTVEVTCPDEREIKAGDVFECTATPALGGQLTVQVTQDDDQGNITWSVTQTTGLLDLQKVVAAVHDGIMQQLTVDATIDCGAGQYRAAVAGETFTCTATTADGQSALVDVEVLDTDGNINWSLAPQ